MRAFTLTSSCITPPFSDCPNNKDLLKKSVNPLVQCTIKYSVIFYYLFSLNVVLHEIFAGHSTTHSAVVQFHILRDINLYRNKFVDQHLFG